MMSTPINSTESPAGFISHLSDDTSPVIMSMKFPQIVAVIVSGAAAAALVAVDAYSTGNSASGFAQSRRALLDGILTAAVAGEMASAPWIARAVAADEAVAPLESVYFGVGCFWHIQHEFVEAERTLLGRGDAELTSLTGYAGGLAVGEEGRLCYHNLRGIADYGKLGHGEVVGLKLPQDKIVDFSEVYFGLYDPQTGGASVVAS